MQKHFNCCLWCEIEVRNCPSRTTHCCESSHLRQLSEAQIEAPAGHKICQTATPEPVRMCDTLHIEWKAQDMQTWLQHDPNHYFGLRRACGDPGHEQASSILIGILMNTEYICNREVYAITPANVFSSVGGVLGFFLGGSIVSILQCGFIGYMRLSSIVRKVHVPGNTHSEVIEGPLRRRLRLGAMQHNDG